MKIIGLVGPSYVGSTIFNYLLNSAHGVYGASEIRRLYDGSGAARCKICGDACHVWTADALHNAPLKPGFEFYRYIANVVGTDNIVDTSKLAAHFSLNPVLDTKERGAELLLVYLNKHPFAHAASFIYNEAFSKVRKISDYDLIRAHLASANEAEDIIRSSIERVRSGHINQQKHFKGSMDVVRVREANLEDIIDDPEGNLFPWAAEFFAIPASSFSREYWRAEMHPIGGNNGPAQQARAMRHSHSASAAVKSRKDLYASLRGLQQDYKWMRFLPERSVAQITESPIYQELCYKMGYSTEPPRPNHAQDVG